MLDLHYACARHSAIVMPAVPGQYANIVGTGDVESQEMSLSGLLACGSPAVEAKAVPI